MTRAQSAAMSASSSRRFGKGWVDERCRMCGCRSGTKSGHGLHVHFAVGRFIQRAHIEAAWGRGFVHIKLLGDLPVGAGTLAEARKAAGYLSKYVTKSFSDTDRPAGLHRYDLAQGFQPVVTRLTGRSAHDVLSQASDVLGSAPQLRWSSADVPDWRGAPAIWAQWA